MKNKIIIYLINIHMTDNVCILIMDRNSWKARTDVIIICNPVKKNIYWLPRDLYCKRISNRLNTAYHKGKDTLVIECLKDLGINVKYCICILPNLINENIIRLGEITVPIAITRHFYYPLHRHTNIEDGKRLIKFTAPNEILAGDRIHEYIGARYAADSQLISKHFPDFDRIRRQQNLLKQLLLKKCIFHYEDEKNIQGIKDSVIQILRSVDESWKIETISENDYKTCLIKGMSVVTSNIKY
jgi:hypothetical protein